MIAGRRPFRGETSPEIMTSILKEDPSPLENIPLELSASFRIVWKRNRMIAFTQLTIWDST